MRKKRQGEVTGPGLTTLPLRHEPLSSLGLCQCGIHVCLSVSLGGFGAGLGMYVPERWDNFSVTATNGVPDTLGLDTLGCADSIPTA